MDNTATIPAAPAEESAPAEVAQEPMPEQEPLESGTLTGEEGEQIAEPEPDTEEVEYEGRKYAIPKPLKAAVMMHADYTRKTQEVAEQRRETETRQKELETHRQAFAQNVREYGQLAAIDLELDALNKADFQRIQTEDPIRAQSLLYRMNQLNNARSQISASLKQREAQAHATEQRDRAKAVSDCLTVCQREIPNWSPETVSKLNDFALRQGFADEELSQITDPRHVKILHLAYLGEQLSKQQRAAAKSAQPKVEAKPVRQVGGGGAPSTEPKDTDSYEVWAEKERRRLAKLQK